MSPATVRSWEAGLSIDIHPESGGAEMTFSKSLLTECQNGQSGFKDNRMPAGDYFFFLFFLFSVFAVAFPCQRKDFFVGIKSVLKYDTMYLLEGRHCPSGKEWAGRVLCVLLPRFRWEHTVNIQLLLMRQLAAFLRSTET